MTAMNQLPKPTVNNIYQALDDNADCVQGYLNTFRIAYCQEGVNSYQNRPEMIVLLRPDLIDTDAAEGWYGHVFCHQLENGDPTWVSVLVRLGVNIDGLTPKGVMQDFRCFVINSHKWVPPFAQNKDDIHSLHDSFEQAVDALIEKINRFEIALRQDVFTIYDDDPMFFPYPSDPPDSTLDMCYFDIYGFCNKVEALSSSDQEKSKPRRRRKKNQ